MNLWTRLEQEIDPAQSLRDGSGRGERAALRVGLVLAGACLVLGVVLAARAQSEVARSTLTVGLYVLAATPVARLLVLFAGFLRRGAGSMAGLALLLLIILGTGVWIGLR